ncbi:Hypothetical protein FKW44_014238, partial [Caligus rogercresseyi]
SNAKFRASRRLSECLRLSLSHPKKRQEPGSSQCQAEKEEESEESLHPRLRRFLR